MTRAIRGVTGATAVALCLLVVAFMAATTTDSSRSSGGSPTTTTAAPPAPAISPVTAVESPLSIAVPSSDAESSVPMQDSGFADRAAASLAAEELIVAYVESQYGVAVTDPACSQPETGAIGESFVCYALKPGDLVIALRATIDEERLIALELITNQTATTTTSTTFPLTETTSA